MWVSLKNIKAATVLKTVCTSPHTRMRVLEMNIHGRNSAFLASAIKNVARRQHISQ
jgi:hypothetical protein